MKRISKMPRRTANRSITLLATLVIFAVVDTTHGQTLLRGTKPAHPVAAQTARKTDGKTTPAKKPAKRPPANSSQTGTTANVAEGVAVQAALDRAGYSPGIIDGLIGTKTTTAIRAFQSARGLPATGKLDRETRLALGVDAAPATTPYRLTAADQSQVGPCPTDWIAKSKASHLGFESLADVAAHHGHCSRRLLERLNVGKDLSKLKVGDMVVIPNVERRPASKSAARVQIDFATKTVKAFDASGALLTLMHCSIAREVSQRPSGACKVATISLNPTYTFRPESWPEAKGIDRPLLIPPGARNPVGLCWIGLDKKGYGIHGTPEPELIGKTGSHGCIRLANWDVLRLSEMVSIGTAVTFIDSSAGAVAQAE